MAEWRAKVSRTGRASARSMCVCVWERHDRCVTTGEKWVTATRPIDRVPGTQRHVRHFYRGGIEAIFLGAPFPVLRRGVERAKISRNADVPRPIRPRNAITLPRWLRKTRTNNSRVFDPYVDATTHTDATKINITCIFDDSYFVRVDSFSSVQHFW